MKVLKYSNDTNTNNIIFKRGLKEGSLEGHVLVADNSFGEGISKEQIQKTINAIKSTGIEYVIAPCFVKEFYKNANDIGLHLIKCSDSKSIGKGGDNIEVYLRDGLILNTDTEQEFKFKSHS
ncbi:MAG: hypothetical protein ACUZ8I_10255 [Candidatus Scalindua sp.]